MELVGEFMGEDQDKSIWRYFRNHWHDWFPNLGSRSTFVKQSAALLVLIIGAYLTLSGLYLILFLIEHGFSFDTQTNFMLGLFVANSLICSGTIWLGLLLGKQI